MGIRGEGRWSFHDGCFSALLGTKAPASHPASQSNVESFLPYTASHLSPAKQGACSVFVTALLPFSTTPC